MVSQNESLTVFNNNIEMYLINLFLKCILGILKEPETKRFTSITVTGRGSARIDCRHCKIT